MSNAVSTRVLAVRAVRLTPPGTVSSPAYSLRGAPGDTAYCHFVIENLGNARDSLAVTATSVAPSTLAPVALLLFYDANGNGVSDAGEDDPTLFALEAGDTMGLDVGIVLPGITAPGDIYVEVRAASHYLSAGAADQSVLRVTTDAPPSARLHLGPAGNPRATPGGTGSADDVTTGVLDYDDATFSFENDVYNEAPYPQVVELVLPDAAAIAPGVLLSVVDSTGAQMAPSPSGAMRFLIGNVGPGETRRVELVVASATGEPLFKLSPAPLLLDVTARSLTDTLERDSTVDRLVPPQAYSPGAVVALRQTFREPVASAGDVVSLVVTVENITDSLRVDEITIAEGVEAELEFVGSADFAWDGRTLTWRAGTLRGGESKTAVAKFVANTRVSEGKAKATGRLEGRAESGDAVSAGPVVSTIRVENDVFGAEGVILGDVFVDRDGDARRGAGDAGVPGVAVYLESGEYAVTDSTGAFSIPRVFAGYRVVRLDESGLGAGFRLPGRAGGARPNEKLVHLLRGAHARVQFPLAEAPRVDPAAPAAATVRAVASEETVSVVELPRRLGSMSLGSSHFALGKADLAYGIEGELGGVMSFLKAYPRWRLLVEGHTDNQPIRTEFYPTNRELSLARAEAVRDRVVALGVGAERVIVRGYGDARPVATNETIEGRRYNRRVELGLVPPDAVVAPGGEIDRGAVVRDLAALPGAFRVTKRWRFTTDDEVAREVTVRFDVPAELDSGDVSVVVNGVNAAPGGAFAASISRGRPVDAIVSFAASAGDTSLARAVTATIDVHDPPTDEPVSENKTGAPSTARRVLIVEPASSEVFTRQDRIRVRARLPLGTRTRLFVDGEAVPDTRIGQRDLDVALGVEQITWYAVRIAPGWNSLAVESRLLDGTVETDTVRVALSSRVAAVTAGRARVLVPADGRTHESIAFDVVDRLGLPVANGAIATVVEGDDLVDAIDARPETRGLQVAVEGGRVVLAVAARNDTGRGVVAVECDGYAARTDVSFVSAQKPLFATGIVDVGLGAFDARGAGSGEGVDDFHDGVELEGESRLFAQGTLPHGVGVTARLDSRKRIDDPLLKDIDPDRQYPIFGDASSLFQAAPAQGGNYVSLDRGESFVRYGDFRTPFETGEFLSYRRAATGVTSRFAGGERSMKTFVTKTEFSAYQDEVSADGTSGFYYLARAPIVEYSEQIVLETRDRYRREKVLDVRPLVRNRDYTINYFDGSLLFKEAVASVDRDFNPVTIVATYEVETNDDAQYLYGARGDLSSGRHRLGSTAVARSGDGQNYALYGADGEARWGGLGLAGEVARSEDDAAGAGNAFKVQARYEIAGRGAHTAYLRRVDGDFTNPSFRGADHERSSLKSGFESRLDTGRDVVLEADGFVHRFDRTGEQKENLRALARFHHPFLRFAAGARFARHEYAGGDDRSVLSVLGLETGDDHAAGLSTVWEKNLTSEAVEDYPDRLRTQASLWLRQKHRLVASHEYLTAPGRTGSHQATAGVESRPAASTTAYTKYSMNRTAGDERLGAVTGLKQRVHIRDAISGTLGAEAYRSLSDRPDDEYVSLTSGLGTREPGLFLVEGQYEYRWEARRRKHLVRINAARELRAGLAALSKNVLSVAPDDVAADALGFHSSLALAHRAPERRVQSLWMMRNDYERYTPVNPDAISWKLVLAGDINIAVAPRHEVRVKYAFKHVEDYSYGSSQTTNADLVLGQHVYRFARHWDADAWGRVVRRRGGGTVEAGSGVEVGRLFFGALRVAAGYSVNGFDDPDFAGTDAWSHGFGLRAQLLLSDWLLSELGVVE